MAANNMDPLLAAMESIAGWIIAADPEKYAAMKEIKDKVQKIRENSDEESALEKTTNQLSDLALSPSSSQEPEQDFSQKEVNSSGLSPDFRKLRHFQYFCELGVLVQVQLLLRRTPQFADYNVAEGWKPLFLASYYGHQDVVEALLRRKTDVNARDINGVTALMVAAYWGHARVVRLLLHHGAKQDLLDAKGKSATDFVSTTESLQSFLSSQRKPQDRDSIDALFNRQQTLTLLGDFKTRLFQPSKAPSVETLKDNFLLFKKDEGKFVRYAPIQTFNRHGGFKTLALLSGQGKEPDRATLSGWSDWDEFQNSKVNTEKVFAICKRVGHELSAHEDDQTIPGKYHASHAEKQMIAEVLSQRYCSCESLKCLDDSTSRVCYLGIDAGERYDIRTSQSPCPDCQQFVETVNLRLSKILGTHALKFTVKEILYTDEIPNVAPRASTSYHVGFVDPVPTASAASDPGFQGGVGSATISSASVLMSRSQRRVFIRK